MFLSLNDKPKFHCHVEVKCEERRALTKQNLVENDHLGDWSPEKVNGWRHFQGSYVTSRLKPFS